MKRDEYDPWYQEAVPYVGPGEALGGMPEYDRLQPNKVMRDAGISLEFYLANARRALEREFGVGASERMPGVLAALVTAHATEVSATTLAGVNLRAARELEWLHRTAEQVVRLIGDRLATPASED